MMKIHIDYINILEMRKYMGLNLRSLHLPLCKACQKLICKYAC